MLMYYIPEGFAHGYQTLTDNAEVAYMLGQVYSPQHARGVKHNDAEIGIKWPMPISEISKRDEALPTLKELMEVEAVMRG
jgi:dTDP-4-dehydrorhamnose 3,5-epimerase